MPKRAATNELNHNNWNQEEDLDEDEGVATPQIASPEVLSKRVIKTGKRRITSSTSAVPGKSAFSNFAGFGNTANTTSFSGDLKTAFSFLSNSNSPSFNKANGVSVEKTECKDEMENKGDNSKTVNTDSEYLSKLKGLNETVLEWIKIHVGKNPTCILTPIFNDYDKFLKEIQSERNSKQEDKAKTSTTTTTTTTNTSFSEPSKQFFTNSLFSSNTESAKDSTSETKSTGSSSSLISGFNPLTNPALSKGDSSKSIFAAPMSSVGLLSDKNTLSPFGSSTFSSGSAPVTSNTNEENEQEEEQPPKNVFEPVAEEGSVFSQRVKMFVKKKDEYVDNGVGTLYIKPADKEGSKYQAIVRADTSLGNILLNIILKDTLASKRVGKNNVMMGCILEMDKEFKPVPVLLRVKTEAEADNLLEQINKYKK